MKTEEQFQIDWFLSKEEQLSAKDLFALNDFIKTHPKLYEQWKLNENYVELLRLYSFYFSDSFNSQVLLRMSKKAIPFFDRSSVLVASIGIAASILLMINLFVEQNTWSFDALLGLVDMDTNNTNLLFYINS
tara:strand:+ start:69 stop:464 length:396 start_codon:yes stop_codon:yes gene_type:complete